MPRALAGPLVPRGAWEARAEGVFRGAIALGHPDGLWITVLRSREDLEPRGLWPGPAAFDALAGLVVPGRPVVFSGEGNPALGTQGGLVRMDSLDAWDPRPETRIAAAAFRAAGPAGSAFAAARLAAALARDGYSEGLHGDGPFGRRFAELRKEPGFPFNLVGFGPGTTPAGDDFLAGWILGRILRDGEAETLGAVEGLDTTRTTVPGRTLLAGAVRGLFPAYLVRVARALAETAASAPNPLGPGGSGSYGPDGDAGMEWTAAIGAAFSHGASSGRDAVRGLMEGAAHETS